MTNPPLDTEKGQPLDGLWVGCLSISKSSKWNQPHRAGTRRGLACYPLDIPFSSPRLAISLSLFLSAPRRYRCGPFPAISLLASPLSPAPVCTPPIHIFRYFFEKALILLFLRSL